MPGAAGGDQRVERCGRLRADQLLPGPTIPLLDGRSSAAIHTGRYGIFCDDSGSQSQFPRFDYQRGRARVDPESRGRGPVKTEPKSGRLVAELSSVRPYDGHARGMYSHLIADVFLFATAVMVPVTEPFMTRAIQKHSAQRFNAIFAPAVAQTVGDIAARTTVDPGLLSLAHERELKSPGAPP